MSVFRRLRNEGCCLVDSGFLSLQSAFVSSALILLLLFSTIAAGSQFIELRLTIYIYIQAMNNVIEEVLPCKLIITSDLDGCYDYI